MRADDPGDLDVWRCPAAEEQILWVFTVSTEQGSTATAWDLTKDFIRAKQTLTKGC